MERDLKHLRVHRAPQVKSPIVIAAFAGWNDAAEVATHATRFLARHLSATRYGEVDPEEFFVFTEQRPQVHIIDGTQRQIDWPANDLFFRRGESGARDFVLLVGNEPHLRWRTFVREVLDHAEQLGAEMIVTLGGLLADVPHTRPARVTGSATDPALAARLGNLNVRSSPYEGPTGIIGVLNQACRGRGIATASMWGNVPHYINHAPNPKVTVAILRRLDGLLGFGLDLSELDDAADRFDSQVAEAISRDPEAQAYVRQLEDREDPSDELHAESSQSESGDLPTGEEVVRELEEFLKRRTDDEPR